MSDESRAFLCPTCGEPSKSAVFGRIDMYDPELGPPMEYALLQCVHRECQSPVLQVREDFGGGYDDDKPVTVYPPRRQLSPAVPKALRAEFGEARKCLDAKAYSATLVMVRRTLEGTCADQGATKKTLAESLKELQAAGKMDGLLAEWADLLRVVGNEGAHFTGDAASAEDAKDAVEFAEALLDHIYVLRARFDEFKSRRKVRKR